MGSTASPTLNPIAAELERDGAKASAKVLLRRVKQRRQVQIMIAASYAVDGLILLVYVLAGTISLAIAPAFAAAGWLNVAVYLALSESGFTERHKAHYLVVPQLFINLGIMLVFTYMAPQVGVMFLCTLFVVFNFGSLRTTVWQTATLWTATAAGLAVLFLLTDSPIGLPHGNPMERLATMLMFAFTIGRSMFLGLFSNSMRQSLYQSGQKLKEAYRRIEELAELDELTGSFNRRCVMRLLEEEIARAGRAGSPCSNALIDVDHFKRINDSFGHPTGDEVLRAFAITMFANIRAIDRFGRYGGEEFLLILPDTTQESAARMLDRLRAIVAELDWSAFSPTLRVTISAGVVMLRQNESSDSFLARADRALYASKAQGRNRITSA
jgi:diguanylate cyclase (GGDEF)-like protein